MRYGKNGLNFLQRLGLVLTHPGPYPKLAPRLLSVHSVPLSKPLPPPELQAHLNGEPAPPVGYKTERWPSY